MRPLDVARAVGPRGGDGRPVQGDPTWALASGGRSRPGGGHVPPLQTLWPRRGRPPCGPCPGSRLCPSPVRGPSPSPLPRVSGHASGTGPSAPCRSRDWSRVLASRSDLLVAAQHLPADCVCPEPGGLGSPGRVSLRLRRAGGRAPERGRDLALLCADLVLPLPEFSRFSRV